MPTWLYCVIILALQAVSVSGFLYSSRKRARALRRLSHDLMDSHWLMLKAWGVLRDREDFDSRNTASQLRDHLEKLWASYGITEDTFKKMAREAQMARRAME